MTKRKVWFGIGGVLVVILLAGAAFMAMRLLNSKSPGGIGFLSGGLPLGGKGSSGAVQSIRIESDPNADLPKQAPDLTGQVASVKDNSFFVAVPSGSGGITVFSGGTGGAQPTPAGPYNEVVITNKTKIWRDATMDAMAKPAGGSNGVQSIQQKLERTDSSILIPNAFVQVWGQKRGDRLIADVMVVMGGGVVSGKGGH
jgi:hypothetical protein